MRPLAFVCKTETCVKAAKAMLLRGPLRLRNGERCVLLVGEYLSLHMLDVGRQGGAHDKSWAQVEGKEGSPARSDGAKRHDFGKNTTLSRRAAAATTLFLT